MKEIVLDIETTGLEYKEGEKIIEIACVELSNFVPTGEIYQTFINPERKSNSSAKEKHGISDDFLKDKKLFREILPDFLKFINNSPLIAHNGSDFDIPFLNHELKVHYKHEGGGNPLPAPDIIGIIDEMLDEMKEGK